MSTPSPGGVFLLRQKRYGALVGANTLTNLGCTMQQLIQGWLAVTWGHSILFLIPFALARILPKIALTIPAGSICDRMPRRTVLLCCRISNALTSALPLLGFLTPLSHRLAAD